MEEELWSLTKVAVSTTLALLYSHLLVSKLPSGKTRLVALLPVFVLFSLLPLSFSSFHLRGISAFFLTWLANFKLLLFAFSVGPLSDPTLSFRLFLSLASFPVKTRKTEPIRTEFKAVVPLLGYAVKGAILTILISIHIRRDEFPRLLVVTLYALHVYLALDIVLAVSAAASRVVLFDMNLELEPQFSAPYLSTSLQDFWGRRWNLMVTRVLHPTVYIPVRRRWGSLVAVVAAFLVSGLMHEVMTYYLTLLPPTGEMTGFFLIHGVCTAAEVAVKRALGRRGWRALPRVVVAPLVLGFVWATALWLFFPPLLVGGVEESVIEESVWMVEMGKRAALGLIGLVK